VIHIGAILGGPEFGNLPFDRAMSRIWFPVPGEAWPKAGSAPDPLGPSERVDPRQVGSLDIVFHVPGSILKPEHVGLRTGKFSRKERMLQVQIAVPEHLLESPELRKFLLKSIREAIHLAKPKFAKAAIPYPVAEYLAQLAELERRLSVDLPSAKSDDAAEQGDEGDRA
jgi:hypothetical protein